MTPVPRPGDVLPNGAVVIDSKGATRLMLVILAINNPCTPRAEYATWLADWNDGVLTPFSGRYFRDIEQAVIDYTGRG